MIATQIAPMHYAKGMAFIVSSPNDIVRGALEKFGSDVQIVDWDIRGGTGEENRHGCYAVD